MPNDYNRYDRNIHTRFQKIESAYSTSTNHIEKQDVFRSSFSQYSLISDSIIRNGGDLWDKNNLGGVPVDYDKDQKIVYVDSSESHTLLIGSTGSKKSRLVAMPLVKILSSAGESMIISDPKAEIYNRTVENLFSKDYKVYVVNFRNSNFSDGWNFLSWPFSLYCNNSIDKAYEMINDIAINLMPIQSKKDPYWDYSARDLFVGLVLLLFKICKDFNFPQYAVSIRNLLNLRSEMFSNCNNSLIKSTKYWEIAESDDSIRNKLIGSVGLDAERTLSCILSTFDQHLSCFSLSPQLTNMLSESTFSFDKIGYEKTALFIILPDEKSTYHKLATVLIKECYENLIDIAYSQETDNRFPKRINYILDEFSSLPTISDFPQMISASRSRNIRFHIVMQSKKQMQQRYDNETETIQSNCGNWMFLYTKEVDLLDEICRLGGKKGNESLIPFHRLQHLDKENGECLVFSNRLYPYYAHLPDINEYDNEQYIKASFPKFVNKNEFFDIIKVLNDNSRLASDSSSQLTINSLDDLFENVNSSQSKNDEDVFDLQKRLEEKFDELFGPIEEE